MSQLKKTAILMIVLIALTCARQCYQTVVAYHGNDLKIKTECKLSDICDKVSSVTLNIKDNIKLRNIQRLGNDFFAIGNGELMHFNSRGDMVNYIASDISNDKDSCITSYTIDNSRKLVVVIDSQRYISKYDFSGKLVSRSHLDYNWHKITAFAYHNNHFYATVQTVDPDGQNPKLNILHSYIFKLDENMNIVSQQRLYKYNQRNDNLPDMFCVTELVTEDENVFAYSSSLNTDEILQDTLRIIEQERYNAIYHNYPDSESAVYSIRKNGRYFTASYYAQEPNKYNYLFFYDKQDNTAYTLRNGIKDDIFKTGRIYDFQPTDINNKNFCYVNTSAENKTTIYFITLNS